MSEFGMIKIEHGVATTLPLDFAYEDGEPWDVSAVPVLFRAYRDPENKVLLFDEKTLSPGDQPSSKLLVLANGEASPGYWYAEIEITGPDPDLWHGALYVEGI
jgi:hypothetical protein